MPNQPYAQSHQIAQQPTLPLLEQQPPQKAVPSLSQNPSSHQRQIQANQSFYSQMPLPQDHQEPPLQLNSIARQLNHLHQPQAAQQVPPSQFAATSQQQQQSRQQSYGHGGHPAPQPQNTMLYQQIVNDYQKMLSQQLS